MAGSEADSPGGLFNDLSFDIGGGSSFGGASFPAHLVDDSVSSSDHPSSNTLASPSVDTNPTVPNISASPPDTYSPTYSPSSVTNGGNHAHTHNQNQPTLFQDPSPWAFQDTPPYESGNGETPFVEDIQSWELPVHPNLNQSPLYPHQTTTIAGLDPGLYAAAFNIPTNSAVSPNGSLVRTDIAPNVKNKLTPAQQERLKTIAMPPHLQYHSPRSAGSPESSTSGHGKGPGSSPDPAEQSKSGSRKRKSSAEMEDDDDDDDFDHPVKKTAHNMIEKRYRTNLNDKIAALRDSVPALRIMSKSARGEDTTEDREELHGLTPAHKLNKATVLSKATEYIRHLEKRNNRLIEENNGMQARIAAFEKLFMAGAITGQLPNPLQQQQPPTPIQYPQDIAAFMNAPMPNNRAMDPAGMIPVPDEMKRISALQQMNAGRPYPVPPVQAFNQNAIRRQQIQQQQQQQQQQQAQAGRWSPYFGKLMVGSLAGLMLVEALVEQEQSNETTDGRGLFGLPVHLLSSFVRSTHFSIGGYPIHATQFLYLCKFISIISALFWAFAMPVIERVTSVSVQVSEKPSRTSSVVEAVPSLASPIHVRRQAWLTAIQTVWVPSHNFWLEVGALILKVLKYTLRNVFGIKTYLMLTGLSEEQEEARVKAWTIALDAQLAGGDAEINGRRLFLTWIALGTLPETPHRFMMEALHCRLLGWQLGGLFNTIAAKWARNKWNLARQLSLILNSIHEGDLSPDEPLPDHLALLLNQDCDEVLNDRIVQRAHNLAWNKHTTHKLLDEIDGMNAVVEDPAVRSPMDAVAAWYSSSLIHRALLNDLPEAHKKTLGTARCVLDGITLAINLAPIGSNSHVRGLVARAVLLDEKRGSNIATAIKALAPSVNLEKPPRQRMGPQTPVDQPMTFLVPDPDAQMALRCAMAIAHLQRSADPGRKTFDVIDSILPGPAFDDLSLLGFTAAFHLMECLHHHAVGRETCSGALERLAGTLRIWIGSSAGEKTDLDGPLRQKLIDRCLTITKSMVGMEEDPGYVSMDECEDDGEGC
ncbi:hypothetical protein B0T17DRAFT_489308 [Bombardia bombarda]|uniref:BHLH domain-containing protein n=1 Tax=Bombardia bombarda TaxID=252184 RepID=A0AA40C8U1_9PEZI|nr:hypothetical protein B0T17DRAFT_489308 [Bombardia bombarda]